MIETVADTIIVVLMCISTRGTTIKTDTSLTTLSPLRIEAMRTASKEAAKSVSDRILGNMENTAAAFARVLVNELKKKKE